MLRCAVRGVAASGRASVLRRVRPRDLSRGVSTAGRTGRVVSLTQLRDAAPLQRDPNTGFWCWQRRPDTVLVIKKHMDRRTSLALDVVATSLTEQYQCTVLVEPSAAAEFPHLPTFSQDEAGELGRVIDFVVIIGGDGTMLHASSMFRRTATPPIVALSMGTLSFLMPFHHSEVADALAHVMGGGFDMLERTRLRADVQVASDGDDDDDAAADPASRDGRSPRSESGSNRKHRGASYLAMNEVVVHRASSPMVTHLDCYVNGQYFTKILADGVLLATPTGSTAYSLSCGGSIVHPALQGLLVTPVSPLSLSFRPLLFPDSVTLRMQVGPYTSSTAVVSYDGRPGTSELQPGDSIVIAASSSRPLRTVARSTATTDWIHDINELLKYHAKAD